MIKLIDIGIIVLSSGFFLLCYMLFLRKERYHQLNRAYLLFSLLFASLLPVLRFRMPVPPLITDFPLELPIAAETSAPRIGTIIYVVGVTIFFILFLFKLGKVLKRILGKPYTEINGLKVINQPERKSPFSFFHFVVVDCAAFEHDELDMVLRHEAAHAKQWHTLDLLLVELVGVVCWFNPFVWAYRGALKSQHEYAADAAVIRSNAPQDAYLDLILKQVRHQNRLAPVHSFSATAIKSRIRMMVATVHGRRRWLRYFSVIPLVALLVVGNSSLASDVNVPSIMEIPVIKETITSQPSEPSANEAAIVSHSDVKRATRKAKTHSQPTEDVAQPNVLESQSWLSTQYGESVEIYDEAPAPKQEKQHYTILTVGDVPKIYQVSTVDNP